MPSFPPRASLPGPPLPRQFVPSVGAPRSPAQVVAAASLAAGTTLHGFIPGLPPGELGPGRYAPFIPPFTPAVYTPGGPQGTGIETARSAVVGPHLMWAGLPPMWYGALPRGYGAAKKGTPAPGAGAWNVAAAGAGAASAGVNLIPVFGQIASIALAGVAAGFKIAGAVRTRRIQALSGDEQAVAKWAQRAAKWGKKKRKNTAQRLLKQRQRLAAKAERKSGKGRKLLPAKRGQLKLLDMKLGVLYAMETHAQKAPKEPLIEGEADTVPEVVDTQEAVQEQTRATWLVPALIGGGVLLAVVAAAFVRSTGAQAAHMRAA